MLLCCYIFVNYKHNKVMEKKTLVKNGVRHDFSPRAARIAISSLGWSEVVPFQRPVELLKKTLPPEITQPIKLIKPPLLVPKATTEPIIPDEPKVTEPVITEPVKKVRKSPVRSKTTKK